MPGAGGSTSADSVLKYSRPDGLNEYDMKEVRDAVEEAAKKFGLDFEFHEGQSSFEAEGDRYTVKYDGEEIIVRAKDKPVGAGSLRGLVEDILEK